MKNGTHKNGIMYFDEASDVDPKVFNVFKSRIKPTKDGKPLYFIKHKPMYPLWKRILLRIKSWFIRPKLSKEALEPFKVKENAVYGYKCFDKKKSFIIPPNSSS